MKTSAAKSEDVSTVLQNGFFHSLEQPLAEVEALLKRELRNDAAYVDQLLTYVAGMGGKRLRPAILLLSAQAVGEIRPEHVVLSAVIEMIHVATLVHDDILDEADTRRHRATVNRRWNNESSVLLGDYLFTHAFYLASTLETTHACRSIGHATNKVCAGELRQVGNRGNLDLTEVEYFDIIQGKTAELCACATYLGAYYAEGDPELCQQLQQYGRDLGMAFQIADDLLDLTGDEAHTGKSLGTDLEKQKLTLPLIHLLNQASPSDAGRIRELIESSSPEQSRAELLEWLSNYGSLDYTRERADALAADAVRRLDALRPSTARETLELLATFAVARSH